jgi:hypothetical protein
MKIALPIKVPNATESFNHRAKDKGTNMTRVLEDEALHDGQFGAGPAGCSQDFRSFQHCAQEDMIAEG